MSQEKRLLFFAKGTMPEVRRALLDAIRAELDTAYVMSPNNDKEMLLELYKKGGKSEC